MARHIYRTSGTCSVEISFELDGDIIKNIRFLNGCNGNAKGISALADGMRADDLIRKLAGIRCDKRKTSCPDQLARAVRLALEQRA